jgi:hypothetical protein
MKKLWGRVFFHVKNRGGDSGRQPAPLGRTESGGAHFDLDYGFSAAWALQPQRETGGAVERQRSSRSDGNDQTKREIFAVAAPYLNFSGYLAVRPA